MALDESGEQFESVRRLIRDRLDDARKRLEAGGFDPYTNSPLDWDQKGLPTVAESLGMPVETVQAVLRAVAKARLRGLLIEGPLSFPQDPKEIIHNAFAIRDEVASLSGGAIKDFEGGGRGLGLSMLNFVEAFDEMIEDFRSWESPAPETP